jgi:hypothetical protein
MFVHCCASALRWWLSLGPQAAGPPGGSRWPRPAWRTHDFAALLAAQGGSLGRNFRRLTAGLGSHCVTAPQHAASAVQDR